MPHASRFVLHVLAAVAEHERQIIGERTKAALAAARARSVRLGLNGAALAVRHRAEAVVFAVKVRPAIQAAIRSGAHTTREIANSLNGAGLSAPEGGKWHPTTVLRTLRRIAEVQDNRY